MNLVIFHAQCRDGFCSAWVVHKAFGGRVAAARGDYPYPIFHAAQYGTEPPDVDGHDVVMVDFSYPRDVMIDIARRATSLLVLDHHRTAEQAMRGLADDPALGPGRDVAVVFDMNRSGAGLAWDHYFPGQPRPWLVDYVEDRDLWRKVLPHTDEVNAYVSVMPFEFGEWDAQVEMGLRDSVVESGGIVIRKTRQYVTEVLKNARPRVVAGYLVPMVNVPQVDISEVLHELASRETAPYGAPPTFAAGWWQRSDGRFQVSLRSIGDFDVSAVAEAFGGGGHKNAAGFEVDAMTDPLEPEG